MSSPTRASVLVALVTTALPAGLGAATPELRALFPQQAAVTAPGGQLARLVLPPEVIADCRADLSDLRIFDAEGREVPYFVDGGSPPATGREVESTFAPPILTAAREEVARAGAPNLLRERYELTAPEAAAAGTAWELVAASPRPAFVRRVTVTGDDGTPLAEGSWFRLRQPPRERLRLALPPTASRRLAVTLEGDEGFYLEPALHFESARALPPAERAEVTLAETGRSAEAGRTRVELERPRGLVPDLLRLSTSTAAFRRQVEVWDEGPGAAAEALGRGTVFRVPALAPVEELELAPLAAARGDRLRLVIFDGDSPPLTDLVVHAVARRPALVFALPGTGETAATLAFGGGRAFPPRYDLAALVPAKETLRGADAEIGERLYDPALLGTARLGEITANERFDPAPVLAFAHRPGSVLDARRLRYRRELTATPSPEGLVRLTLGLEDLARAREDLADLRVVDAEDRQWAYLVEREADELVRSLTPPSPETRDGTSRYRFELPAAPAVVGRLVLETDAAFFDRDYELVGRRGKEETTLGRGRLARRIGDPRPVSIACPARPVDALELRVADGDDAPLVFTEVRAHFPVPALYFAAPAGRYALLLGDPGADAPRYELERVRELILAVASGEADAGPLAENPAFSARARLATDEGKQQLLLWLALAAAVVVLTVLTLRLARRGGTE